MLLSEQRVLNLKEMLEIIYLNTLTLQVEKKWLSDLK